RGRVRVERHCPLRLLIGTAPLVGEVADRPERLHPAAIQLVVQLIDVFLDRLSLHAQAELADLLAEHASDLGIERLEPGHAPIIPLFPALPSPPSLPSLR